LFVKLFSSIAIATLFSLYTIISSQGVWNYNLIIDSLSFAFILNLLLIVLSQIKTTQLRTPIAISISLLLSSFFIGNVFYNQVFHDWVHVELFAQWGVGSSILGGVFKSLSTKDFSIAILLPLLIFILNTYKQFQVKAIHGLLIMLLLFCSLTVHTFTSSKTFDAAENNFFTNITREIVIKAFSNNSNNISFEKINTSTYPKIDTSNYAFSQDSSLPMLKIPKKSNNQNSFYPNSKKTNVVLILMESLRAKESGAYGAPISFTPAFDRLSKSGMLFKNFYANGTQTVRGELSILFSFYPNYTGQPIYSKKPDLKLSSIPGILKDEGYKTMWISGYKSTYANKYGFLKNHGIETFYDGSELDPSSTEKLGWGYSDKEIFNYAEKILDKQEGPFFAEIMTLSNHWPFDEPYDPSPEKLPNTSDKGYQNYCKGIFYTDWAMGQFMEKMKTKPYFENTLFIITSDHGIWYFPPEENLTTVEKEEAYFRMPFLIYSPAALKPKVSNIIASQVDIAPTVLDILGINRPNAFLGQSMIDPDPLTERFALLQHVKKWSFRQGKQYIYNSGSEAFIEHFPPPPKNAKNDQEEAHLSFTLQGDLLNRGTEPFRFQEITPSEQKRVMNLLKSNQQLLYSNNVFNKLY
jgi:phosphoglycerol transferase MdoB-like AlkP superfamily enzyme